jgi:LPPG:FO 2-phospho-L-lactate transferase
MRVVLLSGGVGGARLARGLVAIPEVELTLVVNVGDDDQVYGLEVSPDLDTVIYTMAGMEGPHGWGLSGDSFAMMDALEALPFDSTFRIGDRDAATNLFRTDRLAAGWSLTWVTTAIASAFGIAATVLPATDDRLRTKLFTPAGEWLRFQEYFVTRHHSDEVVDVRFEGAANAKPAPGVIEAISAADAVIIGPSNPVLSIWPILAVPGITEALSQVRPVIGVSPLIGGAALKGPAHRVLASLGLPAGNAGVAKAYDGLLTDLFVDKADSADQTRITTPRVRVTDIRIPDLAASTALARQVLGLL